MIVDDPSPFFNMRSLKDTNVCHEISTSFYAEFGQWAAQNGVKGKFSVVPCLGGINPIDGSLGEYPGHTREERLAWIAMIRELIAPRFTITPEVITHWYVWDIAAKRLNAGPPTENEWLAAQPLAVQTDYIAGTSSTTPTTTLPTTASAAFSSSRSKKASASSSTRTPSRFTATAPRAASAFSRWPSSGCASTMAAASNG
jgi:hypothetical protein